MASRILCSHNASAYHEPSTQFIRPDQDREKNKTNRYKCGSCYQCFSAICVLHVHLGGGSYHYDKDTLTAFPLDENGCPTLKYLKNDDRQNSYCDGCGDKLNKISRKRRPKSSLSGSTARIVQIQILPDENDINVKKDNDTTTAGVCEVEEEKTVEERIPGSVEDANDIVSDSAALDNNLNMDSGNENESDMNSTAETADQNIFANKRICADSDNCQDPVTPVNAKSDRLYMNKEVTLNVINLETNEDGSVKLLLEEKDAEIFRTPHGEEVMKALKTQMKGMALQNTQLVCSYSAPVGDNGDTDDTLDKTGTTIGAKRKSETGDEDFSAVGSGKKRRKKNTNQARKEAEELPGFSDTSYKGIKPIVFMRKHKSMNSEEAAVLLDECKLGLHDNRISKVPPLSANGGEVYVVDMSALAHRKDIKYDKYVWRSYGNKKLPSYDPQVTKHFFRLRLPDKTFSDDFQKHIIDSLHEDNNFAIIHYLGDETVFIPFPHGNSKRNKPFRRTCPSVLEELKTLSHTGLTPNQVFKVVSNSPMSGFKDSRVPRNFRQIKNHMYKEKRKGDQQDTGNDKKDN